MKQVHQEKEEWSEMKKQLNQASCADDEIVKLNIGGTVEVQVAIRTLTADEHSRLAKLFSQGHRRHVLEDGSVFIDRDGETFLLVIQYLRDGKRTLPEFRSDREYKMFLRELDYWKIKAMQMPQQRAMSRPESSQQTLRMY